MRPNDVAQIVVITAMCHEDVVAIDNDITNTEVQSSYRGVKFIDPLYYKIRKCHIKSDILSSLVGNPELMVANIQLESIGGSRS